MKQLEAVVDSLEAVKDVLKKTRKLRGSDLEFELLNCAHEFEDFYKQWGMLMERQLTLLLKEVNSSPGDKLNSLKIKLGKFYALGLTEDHLKTDFILQTL